MKNKIAPVKGELRIEPTELNRYYIRDGYNNSYVFTEEEMLEIYNYMQEKIEIPDFDYEDEECNCFQCMQERAEDEEYDYFLDDETGLTIKKDNEGYIVTDCFNQDIVLTKDEMIVIKDYVLGHIDEEDDEDYDCNTCLNAEFCPDYEDLNIDEIDEDGDITIVIKKSDLLKMLYND